MVFKNISKKIVLISALISAVFFIRLFLIPPDSLLAQETINADSPDNSSSQSQIEDNFFDIVPESEFIEAYCSRLKWKINPLLISLDAADEIIANSAQSLNDMSISINAPDIDSIKNEALSKIDSICGAKTMKDAVFSVDKLRDFTVDRVVSVLDSFMSRVENEINNWRMDKIENIKRDIQLKADEEKNKIDEIMSQEKEAFKNKLAKEDEERFNRDQAEAKNQMDLLIQNIADLQAQEQAVQDLAVCASENFEGTEGTEEEVALKVEECKNEQVAILREKIGQLQERAKINIIVPTKLTSEDIESRAVSHVIPIRVKLINSSKFSLNIMIKNMASLYEKQLLAVKEAFNGREKINQALEMSGDITEKYLAKALAKKKEIIQKVIEAQIGNGIEKIRTLSPDIYDLRKNNPTVKDPDEIILLIETAKKDFIFRLAGANGENEINDSVISFYKTWEGLSGQLSEYYKKLEKASKMCLGILTDNPSFKINVLEGLARTSDTLERCRDFDQKNSECAGFSALSERLSDFADKASEALINFDIFEEKCGNIDENSETMEILRIAEQIKENSIEMKKIIQDMKR